MESELVVVILSIFVFIAVIFGAKHLGSVKRFESQKDEAYRILRQRFFGDDEKTRKELEEFFNKSKRSICLSALSFMSVFVLFIMAAKRLWPSDSIVKTLISLGILLVIFVLPLMVLTLAGMQVADLKKDVMKRFNSR